MVNGDVSQNAVVKILSTFMPQKLERTFGLSGFQIGSMPHTLQTDSISCPWGSSLLVRNATGKWKIIG